MNSAHNPEKWKPKNANAEAQRPAYSRTRRYAELLEKLSQNYLEQR